MLSINDLLRQAVEAHASDLHLTVGLPPMVRAWGTLRPLGQTILTSEDTSRFAYSMFNAYQTERFERLWDLDLSYAVPGIGRFRVNVYKQRAMIGVAARVIPDQIPSIEDLNLPLILKEITRRPRGLILVTGPAGQGKSTTLAAMVDFINNERSVHIVTIEDPIEYVFPNKKSIVHQREVGSDTQSFPNALRAVLREDPNVIVVGEMRDLETIAATLTIAETGHLVFATLHTTNAAQSIDRMIDVFPSNQQQQIRVQLASVLEAVLSQQLLPTPEEPTSGSPPERKPERVRAGGREGPAPRQAGHPTMIGRVPAVEVMVATSAVRNLIREGKAHQIHSVVQTGSQYGMQTMDQALYALYRKRLITLDVAIARAVYPDELRKIIERDRAGRPESVSGSPGP